MEEQQQDNQEPAENNFSSWLQENLRIIVSVAIVILIAAGIYSYSKRTETPIELGDATEEGVLTEEGESESVISEEEGAATTGEVAGAEDSSEMMSSVAISEETESSFVESAKAGDGTTHLARRALANFLEKNPDSELTKEHKIYIEDYLRKMVGFTGHVYVGTSVEFSKDLIRQAIDSSKGLTDNQLENLKKYSARVTSIT